MTSVTILKSLCVLVAKLLYEADCMWLCVVSNRLIFFRYLSVRQPMLMCPEITNSAPYKIDIITLDTLVPSSAVKICRAFPLQLCRTSVRWITDLFKQKYVCFPSVGFVDRNFFLICYPAICNLAGPVLPCDAQ